MTKLKWKVQPPSTGPYRSFFKRGWPSATINDDIMAFSLHCEDSYVPALVKSGQHSEIKISVADWRKPGNGFDWKVLKQRAKTLEEAKRIAQKFADTNPQIFVKGK